MYVRADCCCELLWCSYSRLASDQVSLDQVSLSSITDVADVAVGNLIDISSEPGITPCTSFEVQFVAYVIQTKGYRIYTRDSYFSGGRGYHLKCVCLDIHTLSCAQLNPDHTVQARKLLSNKFQVLLLKVHKTQHWIQFLLLPCLLHHRVVVVMTRSPLLHWLMISKAGKNLMKMNWKVLAHLWTDHVFHLLGQNWTSCTAHLLNLMLTGCHLL